MRTRRPLGGEHSDRARRCLLILVSGLWFVRAKPYGRRETQMHAGLPCGFGNLLCARSALLPARRTNALGVAVRVPGLWFARAAGAASNPNVRGGAARVSRLWFALVLHFCRRAPQKCVGLLCGAWGCCTRGALSVAEQQNVRGVAGRISKPWLRTWACILVFGAVVCARSALGAARRPNDVRGIALRFPGRWFLCVLPFGRRGPNVRGIAFGARELVYARAALWAVGDPDVRAIALRVSGLWFVRVLPIGRRETQTIAFGSRKLVCAHSALWAARDPDVRGIAVWASGFCFVRVLRRGAKTYVRLPSDSGSRCRGFGAYEFCPLGGGRPKTHAGLPPRGFRGVGCYAFCPWAAGAGPTCVGLPTGLRGFGLRTLCPLGGGRPKRTRDCRIMGLVALVATRSALLGGGRPRRARGVAFFGTLARTRSALCGRRGAHACAGLPSGFGEFGLRAS